MWQKPCGRFVSSHSERVAAPGTIQFTVRTRRMTAVIADAYPGGVVTSRGQGLSSVAIAAPAYNEAAGIEACVSTWIDALASRPWISYAEIIVCNDGSVDDTRNILDRLSARSPIVHPIHLARNRGAAQAMATALANTRAEWVLMLDADDQFPIGCLDAFEAAAGSNPAARAFLGARARKHDDLFARSGAWLTTAALNVLHGTRYRDLSSACQLVRGDLLRCVRLEARGLNYSVEISARLLEAGVRPVEVAIAHRARASGRSTRTLIRSTLERVSFVGYFAARRALLGAGVIVPTPGDGASCVSH